MTTPGPPPPAGQPGRPQPQWGSYRRLSGPPPPLPQTPGAVMKPGIVPLAPLGLGTILGAAFSAYKFNPRAMIALPLLVFAVLAVLAAPIGYLLSTTYDAVSPAQVVARSLPGVLGIVALSIAACAIIPFVAGCIHGAVLGRKLTVAEIWQSTRGRIPAILGYTALFGLVMVVALAIPALPLVLVRDLTATVVGAAVVALGYLAATIWIVTKLLLAPVAIALESVGPITAVRRSWQLTRGAFWPILGTYLLASLIASVAQQVVGTALSLPLGVASVALEDPTGMMIATTVPISLLLMAIVMPFTYAVITLIYIDRRIKLEAYDVSLVHAALPAGPPPPGPPPPGPPPAGPQQPPPPAWGRPI